MEIKDFYEQTYQGCQSSFLPNESILDFLRLTLPVLSDFPPARSFLELGCGRGTHFSEKDEVCGVDFSQTAIQKASIDSRFSDAQFICKNVVDMDLLKRFDLILDSHLLHCIVNREERLKYLKNVIHHLSPGGLFYVETMVMHKKYECFDEAEYSFEQPILSMGGNAFKYIDIAENIEKELISSGHRILYFYINSGKRMIPVAKREETVFNDPCVLRIISTASSQ